MKVDAPGSTAKTYNSAIIKFKSWLQEKNQYPVNTRMIITEEKLLVYLHTEVNLVKCFILCKYML